MTEPKTVHYTAAGGIVVHNSRVLVLNRPSRDEIRLPKGHIDPGESAEQAALRETAEESGYAHLVIKADLGTRVVEFDHQGHHVIRTERYFLMALADDAPARPGKAEKQFDPQWLPWSDALACLTFESEREWLRRARQAVEGND